MLRGPLHGGTTRGRYLVQQIACPSFPIQYGAVYMLHVHRNFSLNPVKWFQSSTPPVASTASPPHLQNADIAAHPPSGNVDPYTSSFGGIEVDEYISPRRTFFDVLDDWWSTLSMLLSPVELQTYWMTLVHSTFELSWGTTFLVWGCFVRVLTLIPSLYVNRNQLRLTRIQPQISVLNDRWNRVRNDQKVTRDERKRVKESINRQKKQLYKQHQCSQLRAGLQTLTMPFMISSFLAIRNLVAYESTLEEARFAWVVDLTMPDSTLLLPLACMGLFFVNFELNQSLNKGARGALTIYLRWAIRAGSVLLLYSTYHQPAAFFCYWLGLSTMGLLQPILLRWQPFRTFFHYPDVPDSVKKQNDWLTILLNPKPTEEQVAAATRQQHRTIHDFKVMFKEDSNSKRT